MRWAKLFVRHSIVFIHLGVPYICLGIPKSSPLGRCLFFCYFYFFFWVQAVHSRQHTYLCLIYSQRCLPFDYENCDNLADYLSLQRADQAQTQDTIPTTQQRMSLLKFLAIVSTPSSFSLSTSLFSSLPLVFMSFTIIERF